MSKHRDKLAEMLDEGVLDAKQLAKDLLGYLSEDDCKDFAHKNDIQLFPDEDEESEEFEFSDEDEVRDAFADQWAEFVDAYPEHQNDKPAKRQAFSVFVDDLQRDGRISDDLANEVTLGDDE